MEDSSSLAGEVAEKLSGVVTVTKAAGGAGVDGATDGEVAGMADWGGGIPGRNDADNDAIAGLALALTACKETAHRISSGISIPRKVIPNASFCSSMPGEGTLEEAAVCASHGPLAEPYSSGGPSAGLWDNTNLLPLLL